MEIGSPTTRAPDAGSVFIATGDRPIPHQLPPQPTRLIGREEELTQLGALLSDKEIRLLTLTGPGGVGKTRLAIAAAELVLGQYPDGVWFVDLTPLADSALVLPTIARVTGVRVRPGQDHHEALVAYLLDRAALLLLDNLEHLLAAVPSLDALLVDCAALTMLVTSRQPLQLRREQVVEVQPLPVPSPQRGSWTVGGLAAMPAIELFVDRAQATDADFALDESNAAAVAELSRRLDGLPLAMELAAARIRLLEPAALLARVEHGLALLRWDSPDLPPRHRTLRATLDWSYTLLSSQEQAVFRCLGVYAGGFTLEAVDAVVETDKLGVESLDVVQGLVDKHLVRVLGDAAEEPRFGQLATVREFALERLAESGEAEATRDLHRAYYLALAEQAGGAMHSPDETRWLNRLDREVDNLRLAHDWAITQGDAEAEWRLVAALSLFWVLRDYLREGVERSNAALSRGYVADPALRARFLEGAGLLAQWSGDEARAVAVFEESLAAAEAAGDRARTIHVLGHLGYVVYAQGDVARARALFTEMLALAREADSGPMIGLAFVYRVLSAIGPHGSAREREQLRSELEEPVALLREAGLHRILALLLAGRAWLLIDVDAPSALAALREALALGRGVDEPVVMSFVPWLALQLVAARLPAELLARLSGGVATVFARSEVVGGRQTIDFLGAPQERAGLAQAVAAAREELGEAAFAAAENAGRALSLAELVDELLAVLEDGDEALATWTRGAVHAQRPDNLLSPRQREVLALVAAGRSNKEIADALFIAHSTVKSHVASLLTKLDADNRAQLATVAAQRGLLVD